MILLDTSVVSAMMRLNLEPAVAAWLRTVPRQQLFTSTPAVFELCHGIEKRPQGQRRRVLQAAFEQVVAVSLESRIIPFDTEAAKAAGRVHAIQRGRGRNTSVPDSQIAGIVLSRYFRLATGDLDDFADLGIEIINPWNFT